MLFPEDYLDADSPPTQTLPNADSPYNTLTRRMNTVEDGRWPSLSLSNNDAPKIHS
jgi:hypothetical protein